MSTPPSARREILTSTSDDRVSISWLWEFCAPLVSPPPTVSRTMVLLSLLIWSSRLLTWVTLSPIRLSASSDRLDRSAETDPDWSRNAVMELRAWLRETLDAGSWVADEKAENAWPSRLK